MIQETEDQVVIEESSPPKSSPGSGGGSNGEPPDNTSSNGLEKWVIKLEQSVNIFLTVQIAILKSVLMFSLLCSSMYAVYSMELHH